MLVGVLWWATVDDRDPRPRGEGRSEPDAPDPPAAPTPEPSRVDTSDPPKRADLEAFFDAATTYFDLDEDIYVGRLAFRQALDAQKERGHDVLGDLPFLRETIYQCRYFFPQMDDKSWREDEDIDTYETKGQQHHLKSEDIHLAFSLPRSYPEQNKAFYQRPRPPPLPLLVSTIEREDYWGQDFPGFHLIERRFPRDVVGDLLDRWAVLVPIAPAGRYVDDDGRLLLEWLTYPMSRFFPRYHVDFDRIVLDGGPEVLLAATSQPLLYAGFIVRAGSPLSAETKALVPNFAPVPIFVEDDPALARKLVEAGHPAVTTGSARDIPAWLARLERTAPTRFSWRVEGSEHQFAYWVNLEQVDWGARERTLDVEVVDTEDDPNTIRITTTGIREATLFLNDDIVDLDRRVRVLWNDRLVVANTLERDLDVTFNRDPFKIRESVYFGLLFPVRVRLVGGEARVVPGAETVGPVSGGR